MSRLASQPDKCLILVKALPHKSSNYFETVCCAGIGHDTKWRRLYPVPFRILQESQRFTRWNWISYEYTDPAHDGRRESQKVVPESITVGPKLKPAERSRLLTLLMRESVDEAVSKGESLALVKPLDLTFRWRRKSDAELSIEREKHAALANQLSMFDQVVAKPLEPCPYEFTFKWKSSTSKTHTHTCDDWETSTAFFRRCGRLGEAEALRSLKHTYEVEYLERGMVFALGTHSRRSQQWLLVGVLRVDEERQQSLAL